MGSEDFSEYLCLLKLYIVHLQEQIMSDQLSAAANTATSKTAEAAAMMQQKKSEKEISAQAESIADALDQMKKASSAIYQALGSMGSASGDVAKHKLMEGKAKAREMSGKVDNSMHEKPLLYIGAAFAAGWVLSRLMKD